MLREYNYNSVKNSHRLWLVIWPVVSPFGIMISKYLRFFLYTGVTKSHDRGGEVTYMQILHYDKKCRGFSVQSIIMPIRTIVWRQT